MNPVWINFLSSLSAGLVGTFAGVSFAFWLNRHWEKRVHTKDEIRFLRAVYEAILSNLALCLQIQEIMEKGEVPSVRMDPVTLNAVSPRLLQVTDDIELARRVEDFRYELRHLDPKLNRFIDQAARADWGPDMGRTERIREARWSIMEHVEDLLSETKLTDLLDDRIRMLERKKKLIRLPV